jgi:hypothetical protein
MRFNEILELCEQYEATCRINKYHKPLDQVGNTIHGSKLIKSIRVNFNDDTWIIFKIIDESKFRSKPTSDKTK